MLDKRLVKDIEVFLNVWNEEDVWSDFLTFDRMTVVFLHVSQTCLNNVRESEMNDVLMMM